ncbi:MAG: LemA family protein [Candidatus Gastranaerophilales bacterium]|nr:LemA family protein [Candidatus Gastranaerophilales bacterium]
MPILIVLALIVLVIFAIIGIYNGLVVLKNQVKNAYSQIEVQLKRRHDLIPNLVETVKGYMTHERETLEKVINARNIASKISPDAKLQSANENVLSGALKSLFALSENYPDLKANQNFLALQEELTSTENRIAFARQFYNDSVMKYNTKKEVFPNNMIVSMFNFESFSMFEIENSEERENVKVNFN